MTNSQCQLLSGVFAYSIQIFIGALAGLSLMYKYYVLENPRRSFDIWILDVSKQGISSLIIHFWNIGQSILFADLTMSSESVDECANYFMFYLIDVVLGVYLIYLMLQVIEYLAIEYDIDSLKHTGYYGNPRNLGWYFMQLAVFVFITVLSKIFLGIFMYFMRTPTDFIGSIVFSPFYGSPQFELILVMILCPFFLSIISYWIQDNFLMNVVDSSTQTYLADDREKEYILDARRELSRDRERDRERDYLLDSRETDLENLMSA